MVDKGRYFRSQASRFEGESVKARSRLKKAYRLFKPYVSPQQPLLDIGSRDGWFLEYLKRKKFSSVLGVEITEEAVKYAQKHGRNVIWGDAHELSSFGDEEFGTVIMNHSLEHCYDPKRAIEGVYRILKTQGILFIEVPLEKQPNVENAHFCNFASVHDLRDLLGDGFKLLKQQVTPMGKGVKHLSCVFRKI